MMYIILFKLENSDDDSKHSNYINVYETLNKLYEKPKELDRFIEEFVNNDEFVKLIDNIKNYFVETEEYEKCALLQKVMRYLDEKEMAPQ